MGGRFDLLTGTWKEDRPKKKAPEAAVGRAVDAYLRALGGYVRTIKSEGNKHSGHWRPSAQGTGIADRLCWLRDGKCIAVELKAPGKKKTVSAAQYEFLFNLISRGHKGCVADSVDCVRAALGQTTQELLETLRLYQPKKESPRPSSERPLFEE